MTYRVRVHRSLDELGAGWDRLAAQSAASVFYRSRYLAAYETAPMLAVAERAYIAVYDEQGRLLAGLPMYLQPSMDPLAILRLRYPIPRGAVGLLTHVWHCYDTDLVSPTARLRADPEILSLVLDAMRGLAQDVGADWYGLVNLPGSSPLVESLTAAGLRAEEIDERFRTEIAGVDNVAAYLARLGSKPRREARRHWRRAREAGLRTRTAHPSEADLDGLFRLVRTMATKFDNSQFYPPGLFQEFIRALGDSALVIEVRLGDRLISGGVCLVDDNRFHLWIGGVDYSAASTFSPYNITFFAMVREALRSGRPVLEGGRRNHVFKSRHGLRRIPLVACLAPAKDRLAR